MDSRGLEGVVVGMRKELGAYRNGAGIAADPTLTDAWPRSFNLSSRDADLASDGSASSHPKMVAGFVTGARTGIRIHPPFGPVRLRCGPKTSACLTRPPFNGRFRSLTFPWWPAPRTVASHVRSEDLVATPPSASGRVGPTHNRAPSRFRHRPALHQTEVFCTRVSRSARTGSATSSRFRIFVVFQVVKPSRLEGFVAVPII